MQFEIQQRCHAAGFGRRVSKCVALGAALIVLFGISISVYASERPSESQVEAAYLFNFGKYVKWPPNDAATFNICILGRDPFGAVLDSTVGGEKLDGKAIDVRRITSTAEVQACRIVYVGESERARVPAVLEAARQHNVLTVSRIEGFVARGGIIEFVVVNERVRFNVNLEAARNSGLTLSSDLMRVAYAVQGS